MFGALVSVGVRSSSQNVCHSWRFPVKCSGGFQSLLSSFESMLLLLFGVFGVEYQCARRFMSLPSLFKSASGL